MTDRTLIIGASGLLGSIIFRYLKISSEVYGTSFSSRSTYDGSLVALDAGNSDALYKLVDDISPTRIINCMGLVSVEQCEKRPEASWQLNAEIPARLARITYDRKIQLVHISTDHFDSIKKLPRYEDDECFAVNQYGRSKLQAEKFIQANDAKALILRTNFFGKSLRNHNSLLDFSMLKLASNQKFYGFEDVLFSPVGATQIACFLQDDRSKLVKGILNFTSREIISKYDFHILVAQIAGLSERLVERGSISDSSLTVKRPNYLSLNPERLENEVGFKLPPLRQMLKIEIDT